MIEIFSTNINSPVEAQVVLRALQTNLTTSDISIDLEDCDRVLRLVAKKISHTDVINTVNQLGFICEVLPD